MTLSNCHMSNDVWPGDDPRKLLDKVAGKWRLADPLPAGYIVTTEEDSSVNKQCRPTAVKIGDFVDVGVGFDIVMRGRSNTASAVKVYLAMKHVLVLIKTSDTVSVANNSSTVH